MYCGNIKSVISEHMLQNKFMSTSHETAVRRMAKNTFDDKSTLIQVIFLKFVTSVI